LADLFSAAVAFHKSGHTEDAEKLYNRVIAADKNHTNALHNLAIIKKKQGKREEFYKLINFVLGLQPEYAVAWCNLANTLREDGRHQEAYVAAQRSIDIDSSNAEAWNILGLIDHHQKKYKQAVENLSRAIELEPERTEYKANYAAALHTYEHIEKAEELYKEVLNADIVNYRALNNYGVLLKDKGQTTDALALYERSLSIEPSYSDAHWNKAIALLSLGRYKEGWPEYEYRWIRSDNTEKKPQHPFKELTPGATWKGTNLFVYGEQGMGDTLQMMRYLPIIGMEAKIFLAPHKPINPLLSEQEESNITIVDFSAVPANIDFALPLMSVPYLFPDQIDAPSYEGPYIKAKPSRIAKFANVFEHDRLNVGICWQGSRNKIDKGRSIPLSTLTGITRIKGARIYSLQRKDGLEQLNPPPAGIQLRVFDEHFDEEGAFLDTAAVIHHLDLVITTDTAMAHLSGAMGKEVWIMLQFVPDWRWGLAGATTPWYPTARLYRQTSPGDWAGVVARVQQDLELRVAKKLDRQDYQS
jgi:tetratricopeptide (TPR) repeat protein